MKRLSLILGGVAICLTAAFATVPLEDVTNMIHTGDINATSVSWGDVNNDGALDLFIGNGGTGASQMHLNMGEGFALADDLYDASIATLVRSSQLIDYDRDGLLDLFCLTNDARGAHLYRQTESHRYQEVELLPAVEDWVPIRSALWTDLNADGTLDILLSNAPDEAIMMSIEQHDDVFVPVRGGSFPTSELAAGALTTVDYDQDGDLDLYCGHVSTVSRSRLFRNDEGIYHPVQVEAQVPDKCGTYGAVWADFNNDQFPDLVTTGTEHESFLLYNDQSHDFRRFSDMRQLPGALDGLKFSRTIHVADFDMDGFQDWLVSCTPENAPRLVLNEGGESWAIQNFAWHGIHYDRNIPDCSAADFDNDGDLDIAMAQTIGGVRLLRNGVKHEEQEWIGIRLVSPAGTPALDCQISMLFNECKQIGATSAAASAPSQDGAGIYLVSTAADRAEDPELIVRWGSGVITLHTFPELEMYAINTIQEPAVQPDVMIEEPLARDVDLSNSPNPFNPTTTLNFTLPENQNVRLAVYDLLGREVALLADAPYQAGAHTVTFDASNLPSGLYFAQLTTATESKLHRMMLLK